MAAPWAGDGDEHEGGGEGEDGEAEADDAGDEGLAGSEMDTRDAAVILIDCHESMLREAPEAKAPFLAFVLDQCANYLKDKVISAPDDMVGIAFFHSKHAKNPNAVPGVFVLRDVDAPDAPLIKALERLREPAEFEREVGRGDACEFHHALWVCSTLLAAKATAGRRVSKRVLLFTARDDPNAGNAELARRAIQRAGDLEGLDIDIELFPLHADFDPRRFYMHIIAVSADEDVGKVRERFAANLAELQERFRKREFKKRALGSITLQLAPGLEIGVKLYCMLRAASRPLPVKLERRTNEPLTSVTRWICRETGANLEEHQIRTFQVYGGTRVFFSRDEMNALKEFGSPGLVLMGFKDRARLKLYHNVKNPYFLYPDDSQIKGSATAFAALLAEAARADKVAVARLIPRRRAMPRFVALLPQLEQLDAEQCQVLPPGFHVIFLPFADDIRALKFEPAPIAPVELVQQAKAVVNSMRLKVASDSIENPALQKHFAALQALALDEEVPDHVRDELQPPPSLLAKAADAAAALSIAVFGEGGPEAAGRKRRAPAGGAAPAKRARVAAGDDGGARDPAALLASGELPRLTVPALKEICRAHGLAVGGTKATLLERIAARFAGGGGAGAGAGAGRDGDGDSDGDA
jgi:ATP-dependent DNA helicase 2 subunit 1